MFKKLTHYVVYLLLVLLPLQSYAAANMLMCNNLLHSKAEHTKLEQKAHNLPCHEPIDTRLSGHHQNESKSSNLDTCQLICAHLCASFTSLAAIPNVVLGADMHNATNKFILPPSFYTSTTLASLQRPPISFS
jgi:hypothetical protein